MTSELKLLYFPTLDEKFLYFQDVSVYNKDIPVTCNRLEITPPNFKTTFTFEYPLSSFIVINSNSFGWSDTIFENQLVVLSDGVWKIKQSIAPNTHLFKEYTLLKTSALTKEFLTFLDSDLLDKKYLGEVIESIFTLEVAEKLCQTGSKENIDKAIIMYNGVQSKLNFLNANLNGL